MLTPAELADIHKHAFGERAWSAEEIAKLMKHPGTVIAASMKGFAMLRVVADEAEVLTLATDIGYQRTGVARSHMITAERRVQDRGANAIFLEVAADNFRARLLYSSLGYTQVGFRRDYYKHKKAAAIDALVLRKDLRPT